MSKLKDIYSNNSLWKTNQTFIVSRQIWLQKDALRLLWKSHFTRRKLRSGLFTAPIFPWEQANIHANKLFLWVLHVFFLGLRTDWTILRSIKFINYYLIIRFSRCLRLVQSACNSRTNTRRNNLLACRFACSRSHSCRRMKWLTST